MSVIDGRAVELAAQRAIASLAVASQFRPRLRFGLPVAATLGAVISVDQTADILPGGGAFLLLLLPVSVVAIGLGFRVALLTLGLCAIGTSLLVPLRGHPWLTEPADLVRLALFVLEGTFVAILAARLRAAALASGKRARQTDASTVDPLTTRELEVLSLAAAGLKTDDIARQIFVSRNTVKSHLAHGYAKLGARNRAEAVATALQAGLIGPVLDDEVLAADRPDGAKRDHPVISDIRSKGRPWTWSA